MLVEVLLKIIFSLFLHVYLQYVKRIYMCDINHFNKMLIKNMSRDLLRIFIFFY